jgi:hypothetical protein
MKSTAEKAGVPWTQNIKDLEKSGGHHHLQACFGGGAQQQGLSPVLSLQRGCMSANTVSTFFC